MLLHDLGYILVKAVSFQVTCSGTREVERRSLRGKQVVSDYKSTNKSKRYLHSKSPNE